MIEVWREGFYTQGASRNSPAHCFGSFDVDTWEEAVQMAIDSSPVEVFDLFEDSRGYWTWWGCRLFDNEKDARRSFG